MENQNMVQLDFGFHCEPITPIEKNRNSKKGSDKEFVFEFMDILSSPIIVFESAWKDSIPKDLLGNVQLSRLLTFSKKEEMASLTEALIYMIPRTFESPLPSEWCNIYTWLGYQYATKFKSKELVEAMSEIAPQTLSDYEMGLLNHLRHWIYYQRRKALKAKLKHIELPKSDDPLMNQAILF